MPSPATTAFAKYVDIPVSYHTGVPNISIPICTVNDGSLELPISLSYHASGIRIAETASWVGLGWNLNAIGQVTRTVNGYPDEKFRGFLRDREGRENTLFPAGGYKFIGDLTIGVNQTKFGDGTDFEPDLFSFSAGGYSGKFYIHPTEGIRLIPKQDLKILYDDPSDGEFDYFTIVTPNGDKYHFGKVTISGYPVGTTGQYEYAALPSNFSGNPSNLIDTRQTWYLVKIEDNNGVNSINISYEKEFMYSTSIVPASQRWASVLPTDCCDNPPTDRYIMALGQNSLRLKKITNSTGTIEVNFNANTVREDITSTVADKVKRLDEIVIKLGNADAYTKKIAFSYDYLTDNSCSETYCKRLRLTQVQEFSNDNSISIPPHIFEYEGGNSYPSRLSKAVDHWGFYNGATQNNSLDMSIPSNGANRETNETFTKQGVLKKINYPTGGSAEFIFESNNYLPYNATTPLLCGGLRIKTIKANDGTQTKETNYGYLGTGSDATSGVLISKPKYEYIWNVKDAAVALTATIKLKTETSILPLSDWNGYHINYKKVTEVRQGIGKTIYEYENEPWNTYNFNSTDNNLSYPFRGSPIYLESDKLKSVTNFAENGNNVGSSTFDNKLSNFALLANDVAAYRIENYTKTGIEPAAPSEPSLPYLVVAHFVTKIYLPKSIEYSRLRSKTEVLDGIESKTDLTYSDLHNNPIEIKTTNSTGKVHSTKIFYPLDVPTALSSDVFIARNMTAIPLYSENYVDNIFMGGSQVAYDFSTFGHFLPTSAYSYTKDNQSKLETLIEEFNDKGLPLRQRTTNYWYAVYYEWDAQKRLTSKILGRPGATMNRLSTSIEYFDDSPLVSKITDENGLVKTFVYDKLMRLQTLKDRVNPNNISEVQATTLYNYHYKGQATSNSADINLNFVGTSTTFINATNNTPLSTKQYSDALGRPIEVVKENYTPNNQHQKNAVGYDALGRQNKAYLPFESSVLGFQAPSNSATVHPFVLTEYEASPLSRPVKQTNVDGTTILTSYGANGANDVRKITNITSSNTGFYAANSLSKTTMTDENGKQTCVFKDKLGRVLLTRKSLSDAPVETYNVYDDYGQLVAVLPPGSVDGNGNVVQSLIFKYTYDNKNRLIEKKVPGAEAQKFFYNNADQLVLTQDGNMAHESPVKYLATIYDFLGRVAKTGFSTSVSPTQGQEINVAEAQITELLTQTEYYPNKSWVKHQGAKVLKPTSVSTVRDFVWSYIERREGYTYTGNPIWAGKQHLLSKTYRYGNQEIGDAPIDDYDYGGVDWSVSAYDGAQKPTATYRFLYSGSSSARDQEVRTFNKFEYDNAQRLIKNNYSCAIQGSVPEYATPPNLSEMSYNFKDQLIEKNIASNGTTALQSIDYGYNLRGWLTSINSLSVYSINNPIYTTSSLGSGVIQNLAVSPLVKQAMLSLSAPYKSANAMELTPINDNNVDLFSEKIDYSSPDTRAGVPPQYNGNISSVTWQVAGRNKQAYSFKYDDLDRLTESKYFDLTDINTAGQWNTTFSTDNKFKENVQYDLRGNIVGLQRNGLTSGDWTANGYTAANYGLIDNLTYTYNAQNQVTRINDATFDPLGKRPDKDLKGFVYDFNVGLSDADNYTYDFNGNLKTDAHKGITDITYNYLNLPQVISFTGNRTITFVYDAGGAKLRKIVNNSGAYTYYDYVNGVEYRTEGATYQNPVIQRIAHTEGSVSRQNDGSYLQEYVLRDHLGNTRVTFTDANNDGVVGVSDIKQINHFYSFGLNMEGNWNGSFPDAKNKYQYGEKELNTDFGLNWSDYGARMYDPATARWSVMDMLADKYRAYSPYNYCTNNPIIYIDPTGMAVEQVAGGYKYTGDDAIRVHNFFVSKSKNYYLAVAPGFTHPNGSNANPLVNNTNLDDEETTQGWNIFAANSLSELANLMSLVPKQSIDNLALMTHGLSFDDGKGERALEADERTFYPIESARFLSTSQIAKGETTHAKALLEIMNKVTDNGNFIFLGCNMGQGADGEKFVKTSFEVSGNRLKIYAAEDFSGEITDNNRFVINGDYKAPLVYGGRIPSWKCFSSSGLTTYTSIMISLSSVSPVQFKP